MALKPERTLHTCAIHRSDFVAFCKFLTGEWTADLENGEIISNISKKPVKFSTTKDGYLSTKAAHLGRRYGVYKHRAIFIAGRGLFNLPENYFMEVDHINGDKSDCRFKNLRLLTSAENVQASVGKFDFETAEKIRRIFEEGGVTKAQLAREYKCCERTIRRVIKRETYAREGL